MEGKEDAELEHRNSTRTKNCVKRNASEGEKSLPKLYDSCRMENYSKYDINTEVRGD